MKIPRKKRPASEKDVGREEKEDREKRNVKPSQQEDRRPPKSRKVESPLDVDPVELARRALDMFRKEVEDDGDYVEPNTTPGTFGEPVSASDTKAKAASEAQAPKETPSTSEKKPEGAAKAEKSMPSRWEKTGRKPMISDDPSIL